MRVQVVYYLSHGGRMEQPHLIELEQQHSSLLLCDFKKRLTVLRGKDMPDAFSWAFKRSYKDDFVWNDVTENDVILPLRENEYIIKGSENVYAKQEHRRDERVHSIARREFESPKSYQRHSTTRASESYDKQSSLSSSSVPGSRSPKRTTTSFNSLRVNRQLMETLTQAKTESTDEVFSHSNGSSNENPCTDVKVYKTPVSPVTADHGKDAATQTGEHSERPSDDFHFHREIHRDPEYFQPDPEIQSSTTVSKKADRASLFSAARRQLEESNRKQTSTAVLRQLLACGGIDTSTCSSMQNKRLHQWDWNKFKAADSELPSRDVIRIPQHLFSSNQDPECIPEVVKETTTPLSASRFSIGKARAADIDASKLPNKVQAAAQEARKDEDNSPRLSSTTKRVTQFSPPKKEVKCREDRPLTPGRSRLDWEKTLQAAVSTSSPPADFRSLLQECPQCSRKFKPDSLKVHLRGCHGQKAGRVANAGNPS